MSRIALLEPPYTDQVGALLARMMPGEAPPIGLLRMFARNLPMAGAMHARSDVDDALWARLASVFDELQLLDLLLLCGWYHAISFAARTALTPHEPGAPHFADFPPRTR
ncbi:hypothetical protein [Streptomyces echinatus]|uniref:hypothetical protein n=1 Tax=Streptomyces echinatus TaxID=67293 RepID=UPI003800EFBC